MSSLVSLAVIALLVVVGVVFERRYRGIGRAEHDHIVDWQRTGERFIDPESGEALEVWTDPLTGVRRYFPLAQGPSPERLEPPERDPI